MPETMRYIICRSQGEELTYWAGNMTPANDGWAEGPHKAEALSFGAAVALMSYCSRNDAFSYSMLPHMIRR